MKTDIKAIIEKHFLEYPLGTQANLKTQMINATFTTKTNIWYLLEYDDINEQFYAYNDNKKSSEYIYLNNFLELDGLLDIDYKKKLIDII